MRFSYLILLCLMHITCLSQDSLIYKRVAYLAKVRTIDNMIYSGYLWSVTDTALQVTEYRDHTSNRLFPDQPYLHYSRIESLQIRRRDATTRGLLKGASYGGVAGLIVGLIGTESEVDSESSTDVDKAISVGKTILIGAAAGAIVGTVVGAVSKTKITIKGRKEKMRAVMKEISARRKRV